ncbi:MAG: DUF3301 domain-containing protein [Gammaproteobacteria bacterium]|nr:DUF3301 domain-containing protein [Gammaproteobacteria bacterium]
MSNALLGLLAVCLSVMVWRGYTRTRERALAICTRVCAQESVQLLDQTVSLNRARPQLGAGRPCLQLWFNFEFSRYGTDREVGVLILECGRLTTVVWPPIRQPEPGQP